MRRRLWFLPESPDLLGKLAEHAALLVESLDVLVRWADGDPGAAEWIRELERQADERKRALRAELTRAFTTPLAPEDLFQLSAGIDAVIDGAKNAVREAEVMHEPPDRALSQMAGELAAGARHVQASIEQLRAGNRAEATAEADLAVGVRRGVEREYRRAMSQLVATDDTRRVGTSRELYRRLSRASERLAEVAERIWYAVLKES